MRPALVDWPKDRIIRFDSDVQPGMVLIGGVEHEAEQAENGWTIRTSGDGTFQLRIMAHEDHEGPDVDDILRRVELTGPRDVPLDLGRLEWQPTEVRSFTLLQADGTPVEGAMAVAHAYTYPGASWRITDYHRETTDEEGQIQSHLLRDGAWVVYEIDERPFRYLCSGDGPYVARLGSCTIELEVHGRWGVLLEAELMLDGRMESPIYVDEDAPEAARYRLEHLQPGAHTLVVTAEGHRGEARRVILEAGETRRIRVELPERD